MVVCNQWQQARDILQDSVRDKQLHEVACNFVKRPGHTYHLYKKANGELFFSMLSKEVSFYLT